MAFTKEQETALQSLADEYISKPAIDEAKLAAEATLAEVQARYSAAINAVKEAFHSEMVEATEAVTRASETVASTRIRL